MTWSMKITFLTLSGDSFNNSLHHMSEIIQEKSATKRITAMRKEDEEGILGSKCQKSIFKGVSKEDSSEEKV
jgi:hypothetical protein